jgi:hypothetical protein
MVSPLFVLNFVRIMGVMTVEFGPLFRFAERALIRIVVMNAEYA